MSNLTAYPVAKTELPKLTLTLVISFFFGFFGIIPALIHRKRAIALGRKDVAARYVFAWLAMWIGTLAIMYVIGAV
jgi:hypothetical protein